jgi:hypothetical protein
MAIRLLRRADVGMPSMCWTTPMSRASGAAQSRTCAGLDACVFEGTSEKARSGRAFSHRHTAMNVCPHLTLRIKWLSSGACLSIVMW